MCAKVAVNIVDTLETKGQGIISPQYKLKDVVVLDGNHVVLIQEMFREKSENNESAAHQRCRWLLLNLQLFDRNLETPQKIKN